MRARALRALRRLAYHSKYLGRDLHGRDDREHWCRLAASAITDANNTTTYNYDGSGRLLSVTKRRGNARISQTYDANGRVATQTELATNTSSFTYASHKTTITDPRGKTRVHTYTEAGALSACTDEENKTIALSSGATGRRSSVTDRIGRMTTLTYHAPSGDRRTWSDHHDHA